MNTRIHQGTALATGASSGIGAVYADRLPRAGYDLILVARRVEKLSELARAITTCTSRSVETIAADLTGADDLARVERVLQTDSYITVLVNNVGIGATGPSK
ncbi:Fatty acyl-CoA reductase [compost metagenome]